MTLAGQWLLLQLWVPEAGALVGTGGPSGRYTWPCPISAPRPLCSGFQGLTCLAFLKATLGLASCPWGHGVMGTEQKTAMGTQLGFSGLPQSVPTSFPN